MAVYRLKKPLRVQKLGSFPDRFEAGFHVIDAGEIVEAISAPNHNGRVLIRHDGRCYRAWKDELHDAQIAERLVPMKVCNGRAQHENS